MKALPGPAWARAAWRGAAVLLLGSALVGCTATLGASAPIGRGAGVGVSVGTDGRVGVGVGVNVGVGSVRLGGAGQLPVKQPADTEAEP